MYAQEVNVALFSCIENFIFISNVGAERRGGLWESSVIREQVLVVFRYHLCLLETSCEGCPAMHKRRGVLIAPSSNRIQS